MADTNQKKKKLDSLSTFEIFRENNICPQSCLQSYNRFCPMFRSSGEDRLRILGDPWPIQPFDGEWGGVAARPERDDRDGCGDEEAESSVDVEEVARTDVPTPQ